MSMTHSENYYTNVMVDKIYDLRDKGDKRSYEALESHLWHKYVDELKVENDRLERDKRRLDWISKHFKLKASFVSKEPTAFGFKNIVGIDWSALPVELELRLIIDRMMEETREL